MKKTQLSFELCSQHLSDWQKLGRNYTTIYKSDTEITFHWLDLDTAWTGVAITVGAKNVAVEFPPSGRYKNITCYDLNFLPVQPFRNPERIKVWEEFLRVMQTPVSIEDLDQVYDYDA
jgi:hypothetical protein